MDRVGAAGKGKDCEAVERSNPSSPGEVQLDAFLKNQGLYRKRIAKDGSCLFRAVAEQVFHTQSEHLEVRGACVSYLRRNQEQFEAFIEGSFDEYLKQLEKPQEWVGQVEISALSLMYKRDFIIYQEPNRPPARVTENGFPDTISLCFSNGNHYDSVYPRKFVDAAALCQSILYEMLYQDVLKIDVEPMISALDVNGKTNEHVHSSEDSDSGTEMELHRGKAADESDMSGFKSQSCNKVRKKQRKKSENAAQTPFPGEVLRAFNPNVYRNIEYEVWQESKQAQQERDYSIAAGMQYVVGDKCKVCLDNGKYYNAHIQAISPDNGPVDVYIEELGEKHSALLQDLRPLTQGSQRATWSRAQGKRAKKPLNVNSEADFRGVKNSSSFASKSNRYYSSLPPRLHQAMAARQQNSALQNPEQQPKVPSAEYLGREEDFPQLSKKYDRRLEANQTKVASKDVSPSVKVDPGPNEAEVSTNVHPRVEKSLPAVDDPLEKTPSHTRTEQVDPILQVDHQTQSSSSSATSENPPVVPVHLPSPPAGNSSQMAIPSVTPSSVVTSGPAVSQAPMSSVLIKPLCAPFPGPNLPLMSAPQLPTAYDLLYPGFALNERGEYPTSAPMHSYDKSGADLPEDKSILRFFYNLGVKAYSLPWWPPYLYLYPLTQAYFKNCAMYPGCHAPIFPANPQYQAMTGHVQNENVGGPVQTSNHQFQAMAGRVQNDNVGAPLQTAIPREINALPQLDVGDDSNHSLSSQATTRQLPHKNKSVPVSANPGLPPQNFNPPFPSNFPHFLSDGAQLSGWAAPPPLSLINQNAYMHAFGFHPMYMTAPGQVYPIQINGGTSACIVDQKIDAPDQCVQISDNAASPKLEEAERPPLEFSQAGECKLSQVQSALFKDPRLVTETLGSVIDLCPSGSEQQPAPGPQEECVNQNSVHGERKPEKASLISSAGLYSEHTRKIQPQDCASHSEINSQFSEAKSNSDSASQSTEKSKVDPVQQSVADTSTNQKSRNNYKTPDTACNKHAQFHKRARGMNYNIKDSPSEKNAFRSTPYIHRKGEREMNRKDKSGKQWSRDTSFLHDSNIDRTSQAVSKGDSKPPTKDRIVERSEAHIGFGGHENLRIKVENQRPYMSENAPCEETYLVNRSDGDAKQFQNQVVVEDTSGIMHEEKRNSYRKQRYKDSGKSNTYTRK